MPLVERSEFHRERAAAVGGSDVPHMLGLEPYGCERRLWYEKKGVGPDFPFEGSRATRRGAALEEIAVREFELETRLQTWEVPWCTYPGAPHIGVHIDRAVLDPTREPHGMGVLEVKCPSARNYYAMLRNGPSQEAQVQLQWGIMCWERTWGCVWAWCADQWVGRRWDFAADQEVQDQLKHVAGNFWTLVQGMADNPFKKLPVEDPRCRRCPFRARCQHLGRSDDGGQIELPLDEEVVVEDESAFDLVAEVLALRKLRNDADRDYETAREKLMARFSGPGAIRCSLGTARLTRVERKGYSVAPKEYLTLKVTANPKADEAFRDSEVIEE